ncbi:Gfo/Idh/MocA family oxidoreductase [Nonomuraea thailandensis]
MYVAALTGEHADVGEIVAWLDPNPARIGYYDAQVGAELGLGGPAGLPRHAPDGLERMVAEQRVDVVIVTSLDRTHADLVDRALRAGADVVVEKPLTIDADGCRRITRAVADTGRDVVMTFNYRYAPRNSTLRQIITSGAIGEVTSVHFEWALDTVHGADYFRRWHRDKANSGGLLIHKASHHFDLINWWLGDTPARVYASGALRFYGDQNAAERGLGERPERGTGAHGDPFSLDLRADPRLDALYLQAEQHDGYRRDQDPFAPGVTIEDNMAVLVDYRRGARLSYSLNAHSPWEGYRVTVNGTAGRAELEVVERGFIELDPSGNAVLDPSATPLGARDPCVPRASASSCSGTGSGPRRSRSPPASAATAAATPSSSRTSSAATCASAPTPSPGRPTTATACARSPSGSPPTGRSSPAGPSPSTTSTSARTSDADRHLKAATPAGRGACGAAHGLPHGARARAELGRRGPRSARPAPRRAPDSPCATPCVRLAPRHSSTRVNRTASSRYPTAA